MISEARCHFAQRPLDYPTFNLYSYDTSSSSLDQLYVKIIKKKLCYYWLILGQIFAGSSIGATSVKHNGDSAV